MVIVPDTVPLLLLTPEHSQMALSGSMVATKVQTQSAQVVVKVKTRFVLAEAARPMV
jgi:hypothetical protein